MSRDVYRAFASPPSEIRDDERAGIFGLETEYVVLYEPADPEDPERPEFAEIQEVLFGVLLRERKAATSSGLKGGYFLQNGGLVHLEIFLREQSDTPILEAATPECRSTWDLMVYARAFDQLLEDVAARSVAVLAERGYRGRIAFGKNNIDPRGVGYGCHENYLVHYRATSAERAAYLFALPILALALLPIFAVFVLVLLVYCLAIAARRVFPPAHRLALRARDRLEDLGLLRHFMAVYYIGSNALLWPVVALYAQVVRRVAFPPFTRHLTAHLVTRQILTGSGRLDFRNRAYEISQRPELTRHVEAIVMFGGRKTIFDLKSVLYDPLAVFRPSKRLTITAGDSNLSDIPNLLKLGTTALILEMIEAGETFDDLRLRSPVREFKSVSSEGPWKLLRLASGARESAMEIQRQYLHRAREFFATRPEGRSRHNEVLELWGDCLDALAERPNRLSDTLDWQAKKLLLDNAILPKTDWKRFLAWGRVLDFAGLPAARDAWSLLDLVKRAPFWRRWRLRALIEESGLLPDEFRLHRDLYFQARKIDLRFHEVGGQGYQRALEASGLIRRLTDDDDVRLATFEAPRDTRARVRGYYIQLSPSVDSIQANWNGVELLSPLRHIALPDPFYHRLPGD